MQYLTNINLTQNELQNAVIQNVTATTNISDPKTGQLCYVSGSTNKLYYYNGTAWMDVSSDVDTNTTYTHAAASTTGGANLNLVGSDASSDSVKFASGGATTVTSGDENTITITSTNTTYSAGNGLGLSTTTFSVDPYTTAELTASTMGEIGSDATGIYVKLGTTNKTAAPGDHGHSSLHTQGTDIGTTSDTFTIDYDNAGAGINTTLAFNRGTADSGDAALTWNETYDRFEFTSSGSTLGDVRLGNLTVEGTVTQINSNEVNIGDSQIVLNADITTSVGNSNGGVAVKRLMADDTTRKDAELNFNTSTNKWETVSGAITGTLITAPIANKVSGLLTGAATSYVVTHNLNTRDLSVIVRETGTPYAIVIADIEMTSLNTLTVKFAVAPTSDQYTVVIVG